MQTDAQPHSDTDYRRSRRRRAAVTILRSLLVSAAIVVVYFLLPLTSPLAVDTLLEIALGLGAVGGLLAWQVVGIARSPFPAVQAIAGLVVTLPLFLCLFATAYYLMSYAEPDNFSEPLTRLDSIYYTVTTFATVGFGDITAVSSPARAVVTIQMVGGIVLVGLVARVVVAAVDEARSRRRQESGQ